ncbi:iron uptake transporter permease EfeU [Amnibacterium sp.]|uniref:iron uptake transporter permease EfeU n=1 Tax=Amnibacterium sp. TaxID=1872496 RepID=UPI0026044760|nr:iron uptake transporter permease EfeU [Amnibacterium sp.]MCU1473570.1 High-affinity iron transporter [Amnibacterium sp.]
MLAIYLIGLREGLEAALIVSILLGYATKLGRSDLKPRIWTGIGLAVAVAIGVGALLTFGTVELGDAEPVIAGSLSVVAVGFVTWMIFWMVRNSSALSSSLRSDVDRSLGRAGWGIVLLAFLSVGREGVETSLFLWTAVQATGESAIALIGALLGIGTAIALGALISRGLVRINLSRFFTWTGALLVLVAAGVLSYGVHDLQEGGVLPGIRAIAYDVSAVVPIDSWYGTLLKGVFNFSPAATWLEVAVWIAYVAVVGTCFVLALRHRRPAVARPAVTAAAAH